MNPTLLMPIDPPTVVCLGIGGVGWLNFKKLRHYLLSIPNNKNQNA